MPARTDNNIIVQHRCPSLVLRTQENPLSAKKQVIIVPEDCDNRNVVNGLPIHGWMKSISSLGKLMD